MFRVCYMASLSHFHIRILLNGPQDARPGKFRFAYAERPAKQRRDHDVRDTAHNPNKLGRICILLAGVCGVFLLYVASDSPGHGSFRRLNEAFYVGSCEFSSVSLI